MCFQICVFLCFYFSSRFHSRAAREGDITHWPTFLASHIFSDKKAKNVWILVDKCWVTKRLIWENLTLVVISMHVKRVLALILSKTTLRFDQLITSLSSDGLIMDWCTKQYTTEAPTLYSARNNLSHIDPDHRGALGDILFFLLRKIIVIRLFKKHILVCVWLFHEGVAAVHSTQSSPIICGSRVFLISVFCVSCRSPSQFLFFTLCVLGNKFFTFRAFVSWETCNTVFPGMRPAPGSEETFLSMSKWKRSFERCPNDSWNQSRLVQKD